MSEKTTSFKKISYDAIYIVELNTTNSFFLSLSSNDYAQTNKFKIKPNDADITKESCSVSHKDTLYFYGGSNHPNKIFKFDCDDSKVHALIKFDFVGGKCASNNNYILLCFPNENIRLCYRSKSPLPNKWWQWFTYVELSYATHDSVALSLGKQPNTNSIFKNLKFSNTEGSRILYPLGVKIG